MYRIMCAVLAIAVLTACKKTHPPDKATMEELLTGSAWVLVGYGYDDDNSGFIEPDENLIIDCQKDNTTEYRQDGSGLTLENANLCMPDPDTEFEWKFIDNEKAIEIQAQRLDIKTLNKTELHFVIQIPGVTPALHTMYRKP